MYEPRLGACFPHDKNSCEWGVGGLKKAGLKRKMWFTLIFLVSFTACLLVTGTYVRNKSQMEYAQMEQIAMTRTNKVNNVISKLLYKTQVLSALVIQNNGEVRDFERVAATILDDPSIRNVILAPNGIVSMVYPLEGNEKVLGLDYFSQAEGNHEAIAAEKTGQLVLGGPFNLIQGGQALVGRLPVFLGGTQDEKHFWGLVSVTLNYPQALDGAELEQLKTQGFAFEIWRISPDTGERQIIACSSYQYNKGARYVELPMSILNAEWYFRLSPIRNWYQYPETWVFTFTGLLISLLLAALVLHNYDLREMKTELEELTNNDPLTGALNRRGAFKALESLTTDPEKQFALCYLDLDKFKAVNDNYGHGVGDLVLQQFASAFTRHLGPQHVFARIGGDEFLLAFQDTVDDEKLDSFFDKVRNELLKVADFKDRDISFSFSVGKAVYPINGSTVDELIAFADDAMYMQKKR